MRIRISHISTSIVLLAVMACQQEVTPAGSGNLTVVLTDAEGALTRSLPNLSAEAVGQFVFQLHSLDKEKVVFDNTLSAFERSAPHLFAAGNYRAIASHGENPSVAMDAPYYTSEAVTFRLEAGKQKTVVLPCFVGNSLASFKLDNRDKLEKVLKDYYIEVFVGGQSVVWHPDDTGNPYFKAGSTVDFYLKGTWVENGKAYSTKFATISPSQKGKNYLYTLRIDTSNMVGAILDLQIDASVETVTVNETIPPEWLPMPKIEAVGFDHSNSLVHVETADAPTAHIAYRAVWPAEDVELTLNFADKQLAALNKTYQLSTLTAEERSALEAVNLSLPVLNATEGKLDLSKIISRLQANNSGEVNNLIAMRVKANGRWSEEKTVTVKTVKPEFAVSVYPGNIWTKEFTADALTAADVKSGSVEKIAGDVKYQFSADGNAWRTMPSGLREEGLTPGTSYYVRALYRDEISSSVTGVKTYGALSIPNSSLNDGYTTTNPKNANPLYTFKGGWIGTRNPLTCHASGVNAFYVSKSSTLPISANGSTVAHMMTLGWGAGNTCNFGNKSGSVINHISAGIVCVGDYNVLQDSVHAKAAPIRPTSLVFVYKAAPYNGDEYQVAAYLENIANGKATVVGKAYLKSGAAYAAYRTETLLFDYDSEKKALPITHVRITFKAGTKEDRDHLEDSFSKEGSGSFYSNYYLKGSQFWLDSFELRYDK